MPGSSPGMTTEWRGALFPHKIPAPIALRVEQCGEVAVVDPYGRGGGDGGFGVEGHAEAGALDHADIVGAVADHPRVDIVEIEGFTQLGQSSEFGGTAHNRLDHFA